MTDGTGTGAVSSGERVRAAVGARIAETTGLAVGLGQFPQLAHHALALAHTVLEPSGGALLALLFALQLLLDVDSGAHIYRSGVQVYKCHAYRIEPFLDNHERVNEIEDRGIFAVDGESIDGPMIGPVQGRVMAGMARVMKLA